MLNEEQIKEVMRRADEIADYAWKEGVSDGAYSNAKQDRECRAESRTELEAYLRTIGKPESVNAEMLEALKAARESVSDGLETTGSCELEWSIEDKKLLERINSAIYRAESAVDTSADQPPKGED